MSFFSFQIGRQSANAPSWQAHPLHRPSFSLIYTPFEAAATEAKIGDQARLGKPHKQAFPEGPAVFGSVLSKCASSVACYLGFLAFHSPSSQLSLAEGHSSAR